MEWNSLRHWKIIIDPAWSHGPAKQACPDLKCVHGYNVFSPAVPGHPKGRSICQWLATYATSFCSRSRGFQRWSREMSSKPNSSRRHPLRAKQSHYARDRTKDKPPAVWKRHTMQNYKTERTRARFSSHALQIQSKQSKGEGKKRPEACTSNSRADSAEIRLSWAEKPDIAWEAQKCGIASELKVTLSSAAS